MNASRKWLTGLSVAALTLAACGSDSSTSSSGGDATTGSSPAGTSGGSSPAGTSGGSSAAPAPGGGIRLQVMIAASGPAETAAVEGAVKAWEAESGNSVELIPAKDINLQLGQALAGGEPPDVFYVNADKFQEYAGGGSLAAVGDKLDKPDDFYASLRSVFTYNDKLYCAPKDYSSLGLIINKKSWAAAGLTDGDVPKTWDDLAAVAKKLTAGTQVGLASGATRDRLGAFMVGAGGYFVDKEQKKVTADSPENLKALEYIKSLLDAGSFKYSEKLDVEWGGEAFGKEKAAMVIEGNWIRGAMKNDFPTVEYTVAELPKGPAGPGSMVFTQCWGVAQASKNQDAAVSFVNFMTKVDTQLTLADAFGVMPSRASAKDKFLAAHPDDAPFIAAGDYGRGQVTLPAFNTVLAEFDKGLLALADGSTDPKALLAETQKNGEDALGG
jgi:multiple sugar transport system substrate-binding protein